MNFSPKALVGVAVMSLALTASAQSFDLSWLSLSFETATGSVSTAETIDVNVRVSLSSDAAMSFRFKGGDEYLPASSADSIMSGAENYLYGYRWDQGLGQNVEAEIAYFTSARLEFYIICGSTFDPSWCSSNDYRLNEYVIWGVGDASIAREVNISPGESLVFSAFRLVPVDGSVKSGVHKGILPILDFRAEGYDNNENPVVVTYTIARLGCWDDECQFMRTVLAVPEPNTYALMLAGLGAVAGAARARRRASC